jgi:hypothetical protein
MADFNCIYDTFDVMALGACMEALGLVLVQSDFYDSPSFVRTSVEPFLAPTQYPHVVHAYFEADVERVALERIESKAKPGEVFYSIKDLNIPEHLSFSAFLREDESHAGFFGVSYHPQYLDDRDRHLIPASTKLKSLYAKLKRSIQKFATMVHAGKQSYLVLDSAAGQLKARRIRTTFGEKFDAEVVHSLVSKRPRAVRPGDR